MQTITQLTSVKKRKLIFEDDDDSNKTEDTVSLTSLATETDVYKSLGELDDEFADPPLWWKTHSIELPILSSIVKKSLCSSYLSLL